MAHFIGAETRKLEKRSAEGCVFDRQFPWHKSCNDV
jgi:hypothetical protein